MQHNFLTRLLLTLTLLVGFSPSVWADEHNEAARYAGFEALPAAQEGDIVFIGNSITHMMNWWEAYGNKHNVHGRGNSGAKTYQALANLESMIAGQPSKAFVMLGTNDFGNGDNPQHVALLVKTLCKRILLESPRTTVYLQSILPSNNGAGRNQANMTTANNLLKQWVDAEHNERLVYVDLYALLDNGSGSIRNSSNNRTTSWSYDDLHLTPRAYRVWMNEIEQYLDGAECVIPDNDDLQNLHADQQTSWGARIATFGTMPVTGSDILLFGDDFIHYGEWHEMISSSTAGESSTDFKDRGTGWQFFSSNISRVQAALEPALSKTQYNVQKCGVQRVTPRAICISAGGRNIMDGNDDSAIQQAYLGLVNAARAQVDASTPIFLMSILPLDNATKNAQVKTLNAYMQTLASTMTNVYYVDLYGAMTTGDAQTAEYFHANRPVTISGTRINPYPTPLGYVKAANVLCAKLNSVLGTHYTAISETAAQANIDRFKNRTIVGNAVNDAVSKLFNVGNGIGQYSATSVAAAETAVAKACEVLYDNTELTAERANAAIEPLANLGLELNLTPQLTDAQGHQQYYRLKSQRGGRYVTAERGNANVLGTTAIGTGSYWCFVSRTDGNYDLVNYLTGSYISADGVGSGSALKSVSQSPSKGWRIDTSDTDGYVTIVGDGIQFNQQNNGSYYVLNWGDGTKKDDQGCRYIVEAIDYDTLPEIVEEEDLTYQLTDVAGTVHTFTARGTAGQTAPTITGAAGATLTNASWSGSTYKATVNFPFAVSKQGGTTKYVGISAFNGTEFYYYAKDGGVRVKKGSQPNTYSFAWCIYPSIDENGKFTFTIKNAETETYINSTSNADCHNAGAVTLTAQGTPVTYANNAFVLPTNKYLSVNSSSPTDEQIVGTWSTNHNGTKLTFRTLELEEKQPEQPETPVEGAVSYTLNLNHENLGHLMPQPRSVNLTGSTANLSGNINIVYNVQPAAGSPLPAVMTRFLEETHCTAGEGTNLHVNFVETITGTEDYTVADFDNEAYAIKIDGSDITVSAIKPIGVIRAMQTLTMMAKENSNSLPGCEIVDWPAFKVRGLMHDIGRSYISVEELKQEIDLLARFKENVFLWHLTDKHGFRFQSKEYPQVNTNFSPSRSQKFYTQDECREVSDYAYERGITIIPEIDMPGHSARFEGAMGYTMASEQGRAALKKILVEVANTFNRSPYIHIGGDETNEATIAYINEMADYIHDNLDRKVVVWNQFGGNANRQSVNPSTLHVNMSTNWATSGRLSSGIPNIDMRYNYLNHFDMYGDLAGIYRSSIFGVQKGNPDVAGSISGIWNDRLIPEENLIVRENNLYAYAIATADRAWKGGGRHYIDEAEGGAYLPNSGEDYEEFKDWETRFLYHKNTTLAAVKSDIPYVKQTNVRWNITPAFDNGGDRTKKFDFEDAQELTVLPGSTFATGAGIWLNHIWAGTVAGVFGKAAQPTGKTRYAWTYVYSPTERTVGAQVETYNYSRSQMGAAPAHGTWDNRGSRIWVNDTELKPNAEKWTTAGAGEEDNLGNINFTTREPLQVHLNEGWNKVLLKLPNTGANIGYYGGKWQYTFVFTDPTGNDAVEDLIYSPTKKMDGNEDFNVPPVPRVEPTVSTADETHWYTIQSARGSYNVKSAGLGANMTREAALSEAAYWKFERRSDNSYNIINYSDGGYLSPVAVISNNTKYLQCVQAEPANGWTLGDAALDGYFIVKCDANNAQLHNDTKGNVLNWGYGSSATGQYRLDDDGCEFIFTEIEGLNQPTTPDVEEDNVYYTIASYVASPQTTRYLKNENGSLKLVEATTLDATDSKFQWTLRANGSNYDIVSVADGKVLDYAKGLSVAGTPFAKSEGTSSAYTALYNSAMGGGRYLAASADGTCFGTTNGNYYANQKTQTNGWSTDFIFTEIPVVPGQPEGTAVNLGFSAGELSGGSTNWRTTWTSSATPAVEVEAINKNDLVGNFPGTQASNENFIVYTGNRNTDGITGGYSSYLRVSAPTGYYITGYEFEVTKYDGEATDVVSLRTPKNAEGYSIAKTADVFSESYTFATNSETATFDFTLVGANKGIKFSNFKVYIKQLDTDPSPVTYPFVSEEAFTEATHWYAIKLNGKYCYAADNNSVQLNPRTPDTTKEEYLWCVTGNNADGYTIYNKKTQKAITFASGADKTYATLADSTANNNSAFIVATSTASSNPQAYSFHFGANSYLNDYAGGGTLAIWANDGGANGNGSGLMFIEPAEGIEDAIAPFYVFDNVESKQTTGVPYRIPAVAKNRAGDLVFAADYRYSKADIGMAKDGKLDLRFRIKKADGTWTDVETLVSNGKWKQAEDGSYVKDETNGTFTAFGDPCIVADCESDLVMVTSCCGNVSFPNGTPENHQGWSRFISTDGGYHWSESYIDLAPQVFEQINKRTDGYQLKCFFIGSGKISQSRTVKVGKYYRLYCSALATVFKGESKINVNYVFYSDDFGEKWKLLGSADDCPIPSDANEPKAEELPDGSVVVSSRTGGRHFNVYHYTNTATGEGAWGNRVTSNKNNNGTWGANCNGEIMTVPVKKTGTEEKSFLFLQSIPRDANRNYVGIFWKPLNNLADYRTTEQIAPNWGDDHFLQLSTTTSAYSTMCMDNKNDIAFFYEENDFNSGYDMVYKNVTISQLTNGAYEYCEMTHADSVAYLSAGVDSFVESVKATNFGPYVGQYAESAQSTIEAAVAAYKAAPSTATYDALNTALATATTRRINPAKQYRLINVGRSTASQNYALAFDANYSAKFKGANEDANDPKQRFQFVATAGGKFYIKSKASDFMYGILGGNETEATGTENAASAGIFVIESTPDGKSALKCTNKTGSNWYIHLAGGNTRLVPWTATDASLWKILPIEEALDITSEGEHTRLDVEALSSIISGEVTKDNNPDGYNFDAADLNDDGVYTIGDIARLIRLLLETEKK